MSNHFISSDFEMVAPMVDKSINQPLVDSNSSTSTVPLVITRRIKSSCTAQYLDWLKRVNDECQKFPGFLHRCVYPPSEVSYSQDFWTHVLHFTSHENAERWTGSDKAHILYVEVDEWTVERNMAILSNVLDTAAIFGMSSSEKSDSIPEGYNLVKKPIPFRQSLTVLLSLYPLLLLLSYVLEFIYGKATFDKIPLPTRLFVGTIISVPTLTYFMIPYSMKFLKPWVFGELEIGSSKEWMTTIAIITSLLVICITCSLIWPDKEFWGPGVFL
jgi:antibiotic biosynthesis monooxygenase (ABM) superfamily enzyme